MKQTAKHETPKKLEDVPSLPDSDPCASPFKTPVCSELGTFSNSKGEKIIWEDMKKRYIPYLEAKCMTMTAEKVELIDTPGFYDIPAEQYHKDPCVEPSLSSSVAKALWSQSPLHAMLLHPRLNPNYKGFSSDAMDIGTVAHSMLLEDDVSNVVIVDANDWRTKAAKEQRELAQSEGKVAILSHKYNEVINMIGAVTRAFGDSELKGVRGKMDAEKTLIAEHQGAWLRSRPDWITKDRDMIIDFKTTGLSANPDAFIRGNLFRLGYDVQMAIQLTANFLLTGQDPSRVKYIWLVQETEEPYACSFIGADPSMVATALRKLDIIMECWTKHLRDDNWPSYSTRVAWADAPAWVVAEVEERSVLTDG